MLSEVASEWPLVALCDLATIKRGASPRPIQDPKWFSDHGHGWVRIADVTASDRLLLQTTQYLSEAGKAASVEVVPGDLIMSICGTIGRPLFSGIHACIHDGFVAFKNIDKARIDPDYLYFFLQAHTGHFEAQSQPGTQRNLNSALVGKTEVPLPPLDEQRRIAEVLRSADGAIAANELALRQRDRIRKGFNSLFHRGLDHSEFRSSSIGEIPAAWQVSTIQDVCHNVGVGIASSATHAYVEHGVPLLRNQNIKPGHLDLDDLLFVNEEYDRSYASKRVHTGDIITMRTGNPGRSAVVPPELDGCQTFTTLISRPKLSVVDPFYLCEWINSEPGMVEIRKRQAGGAQQNLNAGAMEQVPVPLPPLDEQRKIASILRNFPTEDDALNSALRVMRKLLQADLLSGRVRVPE